MGSDVFRSLRHKKDERCMKGYFISIEGSDGSGKSTQMRNITSYLEKQGFSVVVTREPGGTPVAEKIRELILDKDNAALTDRAEMLLYAASRAQHVEEKILPALKEGKVVLSDRFTDSGIAYQGWGRGLGDVVAEVNHIATKGLSPDLTVFLDVPPQTGLSRKKTEENHRLDRLETEQLSFHDRVYAGYQALCKANPRRIYRVDGTQSPETVFAEIKKALDCLLQQEEKSQDKA